jgi:2-polyprenyl-3-methyl-5-hydroxy-6-metoxy-1,4-benzoquinol methylase
MNDKMTKAQALARFRKLFEQLSYSQDYSTTFHSFLDFALWRLAPQCAEQMKDDLNRLNTMYKDAMVPVMCEMFDTWSVACDNEGAWFYDALGDLFMECVSFGRNGQFFTPQPVCDMMAELNYGDDLADGKTVCDPACGSGRMLLAMAKKNRRLRFYGSDNDITCVKMAVLNMLINSMKGEIAWMNALTMEHYRSYHINLVLAGTYYLPVLTITGKNETYMIERLSNIMKELKEAKPSSDENTTQLKTEELIINKKGQISLF